MTRKRFFFKQCTPVSKSSAGYLYSSYLLLNLLHALHISSFVSAVVSKSNFIFGLVTFAVRGSVQARSNRQIHQFLLGALGQPKARNSRL